MYFYEVFCDSLDDSFFCKISKKLNKKDIVIIDVCNEIVVGIVEEPIEELEILIQDYNAVEVLFSIDMKEYKKRKYSKTQKLVLKKKLSERAKEVKEMECFKKLAGGDEEMKHLLEKVALLEKMEKEGNPNEPNLEEKVSD